jgi:coenzyme F420-reducing hydrogenase gamma subunit
MNDALTSRPSLAVWKFASCDGCQLTLLDCEDELLAIAEVVDIAYFLEASSETCSGPYDISLVEGSITTAKDEERIRMIRDQSRILITLGACATSGGIQALRNFADIGDFINAVYPNPEYISTLGTSTPIADHVKVDFELRGCPIDKHQLLETLTLLLMGARPRLASESVCMRCKLNGNPCVMVTQGKACLGPLTQEGCGALCPAYDRGCYGCFGPKPQANTASFSNWCLAKNILTEAQIAQLFQTFNANAPAFREGSVRYEV